MRTFYWNSTPKIEMFIGKNVTGCHLIEMLNYCPERYFKDIKGISIKKHNMISPNTILSETMDKNITIHADIK